MHCVCFGIRTSIRCPPRKLNEGILIWIYYYRTVFSSSQVTLKDPLLSNLTIAVPLSISQKGTKLFNDANQDPFAAWGAPAGGSPAAPAQPVAPAQPAAPAQPSGDANQNVFGTKSLEWGGNDADPSAKTVRLRDRLKDADVERRKDEEAALARERAQEMRREERLKKIAYMDEMPEDTPAGTGKYG